MEKEQTIKAIKDRILAEHRKHKDLDWADIAARKIYSEHMKVNGMGKCLCGGKLEYKFTMHYFRCKDCRESYTN